MDCNTCSKLLADRACYPYNLNYVYPFVNAIESTQIPIETPRGYPWLVICMSADLLGDFPRLTHLIDPPVYPFIIPYSGSAAMITQPLKPEQSPPMFSPIEWQPVSVKLPAQYPILDLCECSIHAAQVSTI